jgi:hypothetical protein
MSTTEQPVSPRVLDAPHGTLRGYSMGCRCLFCTSAKAATGVVRDTATGTTGRTRRCGW